MARRRELGGRSAPRAEDPEIAAKISPRLASGGAGAAADAGSLLRSARSSLRDVRRAMSSTSSTRDAQIPELPRELVVAIARAGDRGYSSFGVLRTMPQVCKAWHNAIKAESASLWRSAALADFPQLQRIVEISGVEQPCFRSLYEKQLRATQLHPPRPVAKVSDYVLTIELDLHTAVAKARFPSTSASSLYAGAEVLRITVARSSERLDRVLPPAEVGHRMFGYATLQKDPAYDELIPGDATPQDLAECMILRFSLTRLADMNAMELCDFSMNNCDADDDRIIYHQEQLPCIPQLFSATQRTPGPWMSANLSITNGVVNVEFQAWEVPLQDDQEEDEMMMDEFTTYLTWYAAWPEQPTN